MPLGSGRPPRKDRVAEQLRQEISLLMLREMKDPRVRLASISQVQCSRDLRSARVMVSAVGTERERHQVVHALRHASGFLRAQLGDRLENLKAAPTLHFELDESIAYSVHVGTVLRELAGKEGRPAVAVRPLGPEAASAVEATSTAPTEPQP